MPLPFIFDPAKSAANLAKHGIDFVQAQAVWADDSRIDAAVVSFTEPRRMVIGSIGGKVWACVYTYREKAIRLISCRRARRGEVDRYTHQRRGI